MFPEEFTDVELNAHRSRARVWDVLGETYRTNPAHLVGPDEQAMLKLWSLHDSPAGHLPDGGGSAEQPSIMLDAFAVMSAAKNEAIAERRRLAGARGRGH
jgi:hypothetical protein